MFALGSFGQLQAADLTGTKFDRFKILSYLVTSFTRGQRASSIYRDVVHGSGRLDMDQNGPLWSIQRHRADEECEDTVTISYQAIKLLPPVPKAPNEGGQHCLISKAFESVRKLRLYPFTGCSQEK